MTALRIKRGTRAQLDAAQTAGTLAAGEPYLITDESRLAVGTAADAYAEMALEEHAHPISAITGLTAALAKSFPFYKADGSSDPIALTSDNKLPFVKSDGNASNIAVI